MGFCHNCYLIYDAVAKCSYQYAGHFEFYQDDQFRPQFDLECARGHEWTIPFKTKEAKKWCRICKETDKIRRRENIRADEEQMFREA